MADLGDFPSFVLGSENGDHLRVTVTNRLHQGATDYWDGNWLNTPVEIRAGAFRGQYVASLRAEELQGLLNGLKDLYESLVGEAKLHSMENWLILDVVGDRQGHVEIKGTAGDNPGIGNWLEFKLSLDQTFLPEAIRQLETILERFPVIGSPKD